MTSIPHPQPIKTILETTGYAVFHQGSDPIWGTGTTEAEARADAVKWLCQYGEEIDQEALIVRPATAELIWTVVEDGKPEHYRLVGAVVCTPEEQDDLEVGEEDRRAEWRDWIAEHRDAWTLPLYFGLGGVSEEVYRRALEAMAWAYALGKGTVQLTGKTGVPTWSDAARVREGWNGWLSANPACLAWEMLDNLGDGTWQEELVEAPRQRLRSLGEAIFDDEWVSPLARAVGVDVRTAQRWAAGEVVVPKGIFDELKPAARVAATRLSERLTRLESALA